MTTDVLESAPGTAASPADRISSWLARPHHLAIVLVVSLGAFVFLGYGTDIDVPGVRDAGASLLDGEYRMSRPPGSFVHELATGLLERVGGSVAVNVATLGFGVWRSSCWRAPAAVGRAPCRAGGARAGHQRCFIVAATSLGDQLWAIGFVVLGIDLFQRDRPKLAGVAWALASAAG